MNILARKSFSLLLAIGFYINAYSQQQSDPVFKVQLSRKACEYWLRRHVGLQD
jgi:hypothetical protein